MPKSDFWDSPIVISGCKNAARLEAFSFHLFTEFGCFFFNLSPFSVCMTARANEFGVEDVL